MGSGIDNSNTPSYAHMQDDGQLCVFRAATAVLVKCVGLVGTLNQCFTNLIALTVCLMQ
jgi:hypothetical protein